MSVPTSFKAAVIPEPNAQHQLSERTVPALKDDEVLIRNTAAAVNPIDWKLRQFNVFNLTYPTVLGTDGAGEVVALGSAVTNLKLGDRVFYQGIYGTADACTFQQYSVLPAVLAGRTPDNISDREAATVTVATVAAATALYDKNGQGLTAPWDQGGDQVGKGKAIVILGGSGSVGQYAIQLALLSGFDRVITNSSPSHFDYVLSLGAHAVLDRSTATAQDYIDAAGSAEIDVVFDTISVPDSVLLATEIRSLAGGGGKVSIIVPTTPEITRLAAAKNVEFLNTRGFAWKDRHLGEPLMENLGGERGYIATGRFRPNRVTLVPGGLAHIEDAFAKCKQGVSGVKIVIEPFDA
ncbi:uncharacterized protein PFL1_05455 [Pseudozyma flocculosa PF-1]|uniref:Related to Zinc-binding oxidoreductase n=2 Tax=Pseudozyma flocculosa TaxID=84751 RepID=A0A5C3FF59_9BASI|nr:uncharacterized protein PFL1_05455 [Pseudozyma flocculosa PF-1]EPQ26820.1 hypothetical protein PFL1_05455 [Pseudozyma flocculosa PF-1]SPO42111.1 related to Zinc-binding oxidoreductase [Pseudozyma flocculosa]